MATVLKDPGGAIVGIATASDCASTVEVVWHVLHTSNLTEAVVNYRTLFGWNIAREPVESPHGDFHEFWWNDAQAISAGAMLGVGDRPQVHPHWLFFFNVKSLDAAVAFTRQAGGTATDPTSAPTGERISICEDPQGAAFGLIMNVRNT
jgi:uncharacterized protein